MGFNRRTLSFVVVSALLAVQVGCSSGDAASNSGSAGAAGANPGVAGAATTAGSGNATAGTPSTGGQTGTAGSNSGAGTGTAGASAGAGSGHGGANNEGGSSSGGSNNNNNGGASAGAGGLGPATGSPGCGMDAGQALNSWVEQPKLNVAGTDRQWWVWLPTNYDAKKPYPLVFNFHGCGGSDNIVPMNKVTADKAILVRGTG